MDRRVTLTVKGAEKRDAGRGVARLPESARRALGVLSGDTVVIEGERPTVSKVWPAGGEEGIIRIDADTRANAGVNIGETVTVSQISVAEAEPGSRRSSTRFQAPSADGFVRGRRAA